MKAREMFRLFEEDQTTLLVEVPYHKDELRTCRTCRFLNEFEFCENYAFGFDESIDLDNFRACEAHMKKRGSR